MFVYVQYKYVCMYAFMDVCIYMTIGKVVLTACMHVRTYMQVEYNCIYIYAVYVRAIVCKQILSINT